MPACARNCGAGFDKGRRMGSKRLALQGGLDLIGGV